MVEIVKLQEAQKHYAGSKDQFLLNTKTSGWSTCKDYAVSYWIKKISWTSNYETYFRFAHNSG